MPWRRLPAFFPNVPLRMLPLKPAAAQQVRETGWAREVAFRTAPNVTKVGDRGGSETGRVRGA